MEKKKILLIGSRGKMGEVVKNTLQNEYLIIDAKRGQNWADFESDLIIDFGSAESSVIASEVAVKKGIPLIVGSTGQSEIQRQKIELASKQVPVLMAGNFSIGMAVFRKLVREVLKIKVDDIAIFEKHHKAKKDSPSGTAIELLHMAEKLSDIRPQVLSERGGKEIGTHTIDFYFGDEVLSVKHQAFSRQAFADGVLLAVEYFLKGQNARLYYFDEIINFFCE